MKKSSIGLLILVVIVSIISISQSKFGSRQLKTKAANLSQEAVNPTEFDSLGYTLLQEKCMTCHSTVGKTHDELVAPPIFAVKRRYEMVYNNREDFVEGVKAWAKTPKEENVLMRGAVSKFNIMPYQGFEDEDLEKIAGFIFDNDMEKPTWCNGCGQGNYQNGKMGRKKGNMRMQNQPKNQKNPGCRMN
ncbi:MAG: hypothetical protein KDE26_00875 [Bacteroidetes bacterium]|nr:hypothetical protein [Bacteroidota bacterium]MCB0841802.1 hypothetical protein [Bacteroidota bacterium]